MLKRYFVTCCVTRMLRYSLSYIRCHSRRYIVFLAYLKTVVGIIKKIVSCINECSRPNRPRLKFGTVNYFVVRFYRLLTLLNRL